VSTIRRIGFLVAQLCNSTVLFSFDTGAQSGSWPPHTSGFSITRRTTVGRTPLDEWSARSRDHSL